MAAGNVRFGDDPLSPGCYSQLLFAEENSGLETDGLFGNFTTSFSTDDNKGSVNTPKMLCFGDYANQYNQKLAPENGKKTGRKPGISNCMASLTKNINNKRSGSGTPNPKECAGPPVGSPTNSKKPKSENTSVGRHAKGGKKEKLGERITALQQLVSPFGKTDTASVLHEALGYIRFLHDQVHVLSSPYLQPSSSQASHQASHHPENGEINQSTEKSKDDLRSRGLCLVPVDLTLHVADSNGADFWTPTAMVDTVSST